ncbi:hypothetical protein MYX77_05760 [Acidobacteriia bacterium AH_259_A11_L15]|nr:hypothetical protein [Acidobacteriia bacterium AH_259_A11_L15]
MFGLSIWMFGGTTRVGSAANFGFSFRMTATGGVNWASSENRGKRPFEAGKGLRSPPPPPPPDFWVAGGSVTWYGAMSLNSTTSITFLDFASVGWVVKGMATSSSAVACTNSETASVRRNWCL